MAPFVAEAVVTVVLPSEMVVALGYKAVLLQCLVTWEDEMVVALEVLLRVALVVMDPVSISLRLLAWPVPAIPFVLPTT